MALNLKGLAENITDLAAGITGLFSKSKKNVPYPEDAAFAPVITIFEQANWAKSVPYAFGVGDATGITGFTPFADFELPINPSEITQDENFAIMIKPTQGGTVVQHSGNKYKDLQISGTTGVQPNKGDGGALLSTGVAIGRAEKMRYRSGYQVFIMLRNWFKVYYEYKKLRPDANELRLIFKNFKDGEFLVVELLTFSMKRSSARPHLYDYDLHFKVLGTVADGSLNTDSGFLKALGDIDAIFNSALEKIDIARGIFLRSQGILRQIESNIDAAFIEPLRKVALALKAAAGVANVAADMPKSLWNEFNSQGTALALMLGLQKEQDTKRNAGTEDPRIANVQLPTNLLETAKTQGINFFLEQDNDSLLAIGITDFPQEAQEKLAAEQTLEAEKPRTFYEDLAKDLRRLRENASEKFGLGDSDYNAQFDRVSTFEAEAGKEVTDQEYEVLYGFNQAILGLNLLLSTPELFKSTYAQRIANVQEAFDDDLGLLTQEAAEGIRLPANTDLETLALKELRDSSRWVEIAELNDLKPPYIVQDRSDTTFENVLFPGDKVLLPRPIINGFGPISQNRKTAADEGLSELERNLGRDIRLTPEFDIELNNRNDYELISGVENVTQAIVLKLTYERGDLFKHPEIGIAALVGTKGPTASELQTVILQSLLTDPRFEEIKDLDVFREGNTLRIKFLVKIKNVDVPVPIDLKL